MFATLLALGLSRTASASGVSGAAVLSNGPGDGSVSITVDVYGAFGPGIPLGGDPLGSASYDPPGFLESGGTTYQSALYFAPYGTFLSSAWLGSMLGVGEFASTSGRAADSQFDVAGFHVDLHQELSLAGPAGSTFRQTYAIRNDTGSAASFLVVRYLDGGIELIDGDGFADRAGVLPGGRTAVLYEPYDAADGPTRLAVTSSGDGVATGYAVQLPFAEEIVAAGGIPPVYRDQVLDDGDGDGFSDLFSFDATVALEERLTIAAGATATYVAVTHFGDGAEGAPTLRVFDVWPRAARQGSPVEVTVFGAGIEPGATVALARVGEPDVAGAPVVVATDGSGVTTTFDLAFASGGLWDLTVTNPGGTAATRPGAFVVRDGSPLLLTVAPSRAGDTGLVTLRVQAENVVAGAVLRLARSGEPDVVGEIVRTDARGLEAVFDLTGRARGTWDVAVANPDGSSHALPGALTIEAGGPARMWVHVSGSNLIRTGGRGYFTILFGNAGNADHVGRPVIHGIPADATWSLELPPLYPLWDLDPVVRTDAATGLTRMMLPNLVVPPGTAVKVRLVVSVPTDRTVDLHVVWGY